MYIKKFYDIDAAEPAASNETSAPQGGNTAPESIAAIMAREGVKSGLSEEVAMPPRLNNGSFNTSSTKVESPVEPTKDDAKVEKSEKGSADSEPEIPKPQKEEESKVQDWQSAIKSQQPEEVLKALGFDESTISFINGLEGIDPKMVNFLNHWKDGGNVKEYFDEVSKDYSAMPAEDVMRHQLRLDYPKASEAQLEVLYKKEIVEKYNLNSYDEDEVNEGKLLLEAKADKYRDDLAKIQQDKMFPDSTSLREEKAKQDAILNEYREKIVSQFNENPYTKDFLSNKAITIGEGADKFTFKVDADDIANLALYGDTNGDLMFDKKVDANGVEQLIPRAQHQLLVATVNKYGEKFITELAKHYKSLGSKAAIEPIDNAKPKESRNVSTASAEPTTLAGAMAKYGRLNSGGW
jgi:hypothetical protein